MSGNMIGVNSIIVNEAYTVLGFISIESIREERSQINITEENAMSLGCFR